MPDESSLATNTAQPRNLHSIPAYGNSEKESHWFPMRIAYDKDIMKIILALGDQHIEYYLPMEDEIVSHHDGPIVISKPMINDLIFVHSTKANLTQIKHTRTICRYLRFITFIPHEEMKKQMSFLERCAVNRIVVIPDEEMSNFMKVIDANANHVILIPYSETFNHIGRKIRILQGPLAGTIGTLRRIKNNKHVHIDCGGIVTAELGYMLKGMYELLE